MSPQDFARKLVETADQTDQLANQATEADEIPPLTRAMIAERLTQLTSLLRLLAKELSQFNGKKGARDNKLES